MSQRANDTPLRLGVLIPCRGEAAVIERKLLNLALVAWPDPALVRHRIVIVDDGSEDDTLRIARETCESVWGARDAARLAGLAGLDWTVVQNDVRPGKSGAIQRGLRELAGKVDLIVLTDADVLLAEEALLRAAQRMQANPNLAMLCGAQRFVLRLPSDGDPEGLDVARLGDASEPYDQFSSAVRVFESRHGRLFSVHGQLLVWRADLVLAPTVGIAADDLDLMLQVRHARTTSGTPWRIERAPDAEFFEEKVTNPTHAREQALRRARAYFQIVRRGPALSGDPAAVLQWWAYRWGPLAAPFLVPLLLFAALHQAGQVLGSLGQGAYLVALFVFLSTATGRRFVQLLKIMFHAARMDRAEGTPEQWEMARR